MDHLLPQRPTGIQGVRATLNLALALLGCGCSDTHRAALRDAGHSDEPVLLTSVELEPVGATCGYGGQRIRVGLDEDDDGVLQPDEVRSAAVVCQLFAAPPHASAEPTDAAAIADASVALDSGMRDGAALDPSCADHPVGHHTLATDSLLDLAIAGPGFFVLRAPTLNQQVTLYTRLGRFHVDKQGYLVDRSAYRVQGHGVEATGALSESVGDLRFATTPLLAQATTRVELALNLDSSATPAPLWDPMKPAATSNFSVSTTIYDSLSAGHQSTVYLCKRTASSWRWHAMVDGSELEGQLLGAPVEGSSGELTFSPDGALLNEQSVLPGWSFLGARPQAIAFDFGTSVEGDHGGGLDGTTNFASPSTANGVRGDGFPSGVLAEIDVDASGALTGVYTNKQRRGLGQLLLASFLSPDSLICAGDDHWLANEQSGEPLFGVAGSVGRGVIRSGALEQP